MKDSIILHTEYVDFINYSALIARQANTPCYNTPNNAMYRLRKVTSSKKKFRRKRRKKLAKRLK